MHRLLFAAPMLAVALTATSNCLADENDQPYDRVNFQVSATEEVPNDTLIAIMYQERDGQKPSAVADEVNRDVAWAVDLAKKASGVEVQTLGYNQQPQYRNQSLTGWKVRQSIRLESTDTQALASLIGDLQSRLSVASLHYEVSAKARASAEERLIREALELYKRRARLIAGELGRPDYRIVNVDVFTDHAVPGPVRMRSVAAMAESSVAPPTLEGGVQDVTVRVSGTIELATPR